ncbi:MAG: S-layer homology domain-containing protein [Clostridia bacterium]|nr:S-layer homology domain-containing protein [Clostridia bacterium]
MKSNIKEKINLSSNLILKIMIGFILMIICLLSLETKSHAANRIVYRMNQLSMYEYNITLRWSDIESGNIQVTQISKYNDDSVAVYYKAYGDKNLRTVTVDVNELGLKDVTKKPNIVLLNPNGQRNTLSDIPQDNYEMKNAIQNLYSQGVINGYDDGTFKPYSYITKEEFSSMFFGYMGYPLDTTMQTKFSDVANNRWSKNIIMTLYKNGVITGQDDGSFGWAKNVALSEVSTMIARSKNLQIVPVNYQLKHTSKFHWANDYITMMVTNGFINLNDNFYYDGSQNLNLTRGQVAIILNRS